MTFDPNWTVTQAALEVARAACEQLGSTAFAHMRCEVDRLIRTNGRGLSEEALIRCVSMVLLKATDADTGPGDRQDARTAGVCLLWLADTQVRGERLQHLYSRMLPLYLARKNRPR